MRYIRVAAIAILGTFAVVAGACGEPTSGQQPGAGSADVVEDTSGRGDTNEDAVSVSAPPTDPKARADIPRITSDRIAIGSSSDVRAEMNRVQSEDGLERRASRQRLTVHATTDEAVLVVLGSPDCHQSPRAIVASDRGDTSIVAIADPLAEPPELCHSDAQLYEIRVSDISNVLERAGALPVTSATELRSR